MGFQLILSIDGNSLDKLLNSLFRISATPYQFDALSGSRLVAISFEQSNEPFTEWQLSDFVPRNPPVRSPQPCRPTLSNHLAGTSNKAAENATAERFNNPTLLPFVRQ